MVTVYLTSFVAAVILFFEGERAGVPRNTMIGWSVLIAVFTIVLLPVYLWWRMRWNAAQGIAPPPPAANEVRMSWGRLAFWFVVVIGALFVLSWLAAL